MNRATWTGVARRWSWVSGGMVVVLGLLLITDGFLEGRRVEVEKEIVTSLEERTLTEAAASAELAAVTEAQTQRSIARKARNVKLGWALLAVTVVFLVSAKGHQELLHARQPELVTIGGSRPAASSSVALQEQQEPVDGGEDILDLTFVDSVIEAQGRSRETAIPILQALQTHFRYLPEEALRRVCEQTEIDPSQIVGVASFYSQFRRDPVGRHLVRVCHGTACHVAGIGHIMDEMRRRLDIPPDADTDPRSRFTLESVNCLGCCSLAPVMMVEDHVAGHLTPTSAWEELEVAEAET